jgi:hypothetical protein
LFLLGEQRIRGDSHLLEQLGGPSEAFGGKKIEDATVVAVTSTPALRRCLSAWGPGCAMVFAIASWAAQGERDILHVISDYSSEQLQHEIFCFFLHECYLKPRIYI